MVAIALVNAGHLNVLPVNGGIFWDNGGGGRGSVYMRRVWGTILDWI